MLSASTFLMKPELDLQADACIFLAIALLTLPLRWLLAALAASAFHELCHYAVLRLCGAQLRRIRIGAAGAVMETEPLSPAKELLCVLAGPVGSFSLLLFSRMIPITALCGMVQGCYNLLPFFPSDGFRALRCTLDICGVHNAERVALITARVTAILSAALAVFGWAVRGLGVLPLLAAGMFAAQGIWRKIPCNSGLERVQ